MIKRSATLVLLAAAAALSGCAAEPDRTDQIRAPAAVAIGEAEDCLSTSRIRETRVHDDYTIDFVLTDGAVYRNTLSGRCAGLGFEERFGYRTTIARLCSSDTITVLRSGGIDGPTCGLGDFVPVRYTETAG